MIAGAPPLIAVRVIFGCARDARITASYCNSASRADTRLTTAANGVFSGTSTSGMPMSSAASIRSRGTSSWVSPVANPTAATLQSSSPRR